MESQNIHVQVRCSLHVSESTHISVSRRTAMLCLLFICREEVAKILYGHPSAPAEDLSRPWLAYKVHWQAARICTEPAHTLCRH